MHEATESCCNNWSKCTWAASTWKVCSIWKVFCLKCNKFFFGGGSTLPYPLIDHFLCALCCDLSQTWFGTIFQERSQSWTLLYACVDRKDGTSGDMGLKQGSQGETTTWIIFFCVHNCNRRDLENCHHTDAALVSFIRNLKFCSWLYPVGFVLCVCMCKMLIVLWSGVICYFMGDSCSLVSSSSFVYGIKTWTQ